MYRSIPIAEASAAGGMARLAMMACCSGGLRPAASCGAVAAGVVSAAVVFPNHCVGAVASKAPNFGRLRVDRALFGVARGFSSAAADTRSRRLGFSWDRTVAVVISRSSPWYGWVVGTDSYK